MIKTTLFILGFCVVNQLTQAQIAHSILDDGLHWKYEELGGFTNGTYSSLLRDYQIKKRILSILTV